MIETFALLFQYGSNCLESEINSIDCLCRDARFIAIAQTVDDYEIAFDVFSKGRGCAAANIVRKAGTKVWGALYEIPEHLLSRETSGARKSLDAIEGRSYAREKIEIRRQVVDEQAWLAWTYIVKKPTSGLKTGFDYVRLIVHGLRSRGVPGDYISKVKRIAAANNPEIAAAVESL
jgi:gamma-glutamylcyclotransferase (GGCT)/AIG2-like uncharacterized protein YtfP